MRGWEEGSVCEDDKDNGRVTDMGHSAFNRGPKMLEIQLPTGYLGGLGFYPHIHRCSCNCKGKGFAGGHWLMVFKKTQCCFLIAQDSWEVMMCLWNKEGYPAVPFCERSLKLNLTKYDPLFLQQQTVNCNLLTATP